MTSISLYNNQKDYANFLKERNIQYVEKGLWLRVGKNNIEKSWLIFISVFRIHLPEVINIILPLVEAKRIPFKIIKNKLLHQHINYGLGNSSRVGKVITLYTSTETQAKELVENLSPLLSNYFGPKVNNSIRISPAIYASYCELVTDESGKKYKKLTIPKRKLIPFNVNGNYQIRDSNKQIVGNFYFLAKTIKTSPKGNIYKALSFRNFTFKWCIIKQGKLNMVEDLFGRTIRDRLTWQKKVMDDLRGKMQIPKILDYFEENDDSYLVMEFIKGTPFPDKIRSLYNQQSWKDFSYTTKSLLLTWYLEILKIINTFHLNGFLHRDIKDGNFLLLPNGKPFILDYELAYSTREQLPNPPFKAVTPGYQAAEQLNNLRPTEKEDIFSLGALLLYLLTGTNPKNLTNEGNIRLKEMLHTQGISCKLIDLIFDCMDYEPFNRPDLETISNIVNRQLEILSE